MGSSPREPGDWQTSPPSTHFLRAGLGWGGMPAELVETDLVRGRSSRPSSKMMPVRDLVVAMSAVDRTEAPPGIAGRWFIDRLKQGADGATNKRRQSRVAPGFMLWFRREQRQAAHLSSPRRSEVPVDSRSMALDRISPVWESRVHPLWIRNPFRSSTPRCQVAPSRGELTLLLRASQSRRRSSRSGSRHAIAGSRCPPRSSEWPSRGERLR